MENGKRIRLTKWIDSCFLGHRHDLELEIGEISESYGAKGRTCRIRSYTFLMLTSYRPRGMKFELRSERMCFSNFAQLSSAQLRLSCGHLSSSYRGGLADNIIIKTKRRTGIWVRVVEFEFSSLLFVCLQNL